ncbi:19999_t:CDS:1, partial [Racocetra persica]
SSFFETHKAHGILIQMSNIVLRNGLETLLEEMNKNPPCELGLSAEELLVPRKLKKSKKPPRAQNKFILYRKHYVALMKKRCPQRTVRTNELSREASRNWDSESNEVKRYFTILAEVAKDRHKAMYPGYIYEPEKKNKKDEFEEYIDYSQCS